ncbi:alpha/beta hydrolase [Halapricum hydrolyticum]|uniref:Alpha/beta hydrolase n=1 Tax=Halapricum hydrolyticum TaxID=2979991 RepID=A0AAE3LI27_9EURY|nr:alpha/beta hydrolase [Halapricum hydrolyticum]MCU4716557.1 alpha/beta hydrolase [Halapricum hydrolyticum]MCU4725838.1 alpha/beta hydrolase [Halapricum hydrolyticum]
MERSTDARWTRRGVLTTAAGAVLTGCSSGETTPTDTISTAEGTATPSSDSGETTTTRPPSSDSIGTTPTEGDDTGTESDSDRRDVVFQETPERELKLDLYLPGEGEDHPFVVFAHGGGWIGGDKGHRLMFDRLTANGYAVADVQYRLAQERRYPAAVRDVVAAVAWVRANADTYDIDGSRSALAGYSAGAHLATLVALAPGYERFQPRDFELDASAAVDAVVGYSGPYDFTVPEAEENLLVAAFFGPDASEATLQEGSPVTHVDPGDPPAMLVHGTEDSIVPYRSTTVLAGTLRDADVPVEVVTGEGAGHGMIDDPDWRERTLPRQIGFLDQHL